jgi:hypothetical protein
MLDEIFCLHDQRVIQNDYTIVYKKRIFQLTDTRSIRYKPKDTVLVKETFNGIIAISLRGCSIEYKEIEKRPSKIAQEKVYSESTGRRPSPASIAWNSR